MRTFLRACLKSRSRRRAEAEGGVIPARHPPSHVGGFKSRAIFRHALELWARAVPLFACFAVAAAEADLANKTFLTEGWSLQSSAKIQGKGEAISTMTFKP